MKNSEFIYNYPVIEIIIYREDRIEKVKCIIDTGSPYTIIPDRFLRTFKLKEEDIFTTVEIRGIVDKEECAVDVPGFDMGIRIADFDFSSETILKYNFHSNLGLIGHNIFSKLKLTVDWRERIIEIS